MQIVDSKALVIFLFAMGLAACNQHPSTPGQTTSSAEHVTQGVQSAIAAPPDAIAINTSCPVSGERVDPQGRKVTYQGQTLGFCCDDCVDAFMANPTQYPVTQ